MNNNNDSALTNETLLYHVITDKLLERGHVRDGMQLNTAIAQPITVRQYAKVTNSNIATCTFLKIP